jgi:hypothetical protein
MARAGVEVHYVGVDLEEGLEVVWPELAALAVFCETDEGIDFISWVGAEARVERLY